ncbi:antibiotic biosynthesis monooxygenase [Pantoea sp. T14]|jgi:quinol monooxygenase YgiN|uniref:antibiotic biosynthesis monooxygenase n=1 Tax=Pantoea sp. T14 TaxID=3085685 RepID=UPI002FCBA1E3
MKNIVVIILLLMLNSAVFAQGSQKSDAPVFNIFELGIKSGQSTLYDEIARKNISASLADEKGTLAMYSVKHKANPEMAYMIEVYSDDDAYQKHLTSSPYKQFRLSSPEVIDARKKKRIETVPQFLGDKIIKQNAKTINNFVIVDVKPEYQDAFRKVVLPEMEQSLKEEDGVLAMYAAADKENMNRWYFYEIYASDADYQAHRKTPHFQDYIMQTKNMTTYKEAVPVVPVLLINKGGARFEVN